MWCLSPIGLFTGIHLGQGVCTHTREDPVIYQIRIQNQAKQNDWPIETWKKCPIKVAQTTARVSFSLSPPMGLSTCTVLVSLLVILLLFHYFLSLVGIHLCTADGPGPCHWPQVPGGPVARIQYTHWQGLTSVSGWEPKLCFKPLQAEATWDKMC